ncbi:MAG: TetR/AcrR family transcriptional regulator [Gemmatimonadota bacterium]
MAAQTSKFTDACVRDRLLDAADELFYQHGVQAVGIDRVLAEAGAAKASLYAHFGSKDELVAAYVERRTREAREKIVAYVDAAPPDARALRLFDFVVEWVESPDFHGCPMQHIVGELHDDAHPARALVLAQRSWLAERLAEWVRDAGASDVPQVAGALMVLFDGAVAGSELDGSRRAHDARWMAKRLLTR